MEYIWIDDSFTRKQDAENLGATLQVHVKFICLEEEDIDAVLKKELDEIKITIDLFLLDHSLDKANSYTIRTGSTLASYLHEKYPGVPIVAVTAVDINSLHYNHKMAYDDIIEINKISDKYDEITSLVHGVKTINSLKIEDIDDIIKLLDVPEDDQSKFVKVLPSSIRDNLTDENISLEIYKWCKSIFFKRPGFLYNEIYAATLIGLNVRGFESVNNNFAKTIYNGVFSNDKNKLWWKTRLLSTLGEMVNEVGLPWIVGRKLTANEDFYSVCQVTGKIFPEVVAAMDDTEETDWLPMKIESTVANDNFENLLFFDELRKMAL